MRTAANVVLRGALKVSWFVVITTIVRPMAMPGESAQAGSGVLVSEFHE
jgi:hypothetical protein